MTNFKGSLVALITPFKNNKVDEKALYDMVKWHIKNGTDGIVPTGTTGESATLTDDEQIEVIKIVCEAANGQVPIMAGCGSNNPYHAAELTNKAKEAGADAALHVAGYYNRPNQEGLYQHFKFVHDNTDLPIFIYNIPGRAIVNVEDATLAKLSEMPRIVGIKDATGDLSRPWKERQLIKKDFTYLSGDDCTAVSYNAAGGVGCISVTANVAPALVAECQKYTRENNWEKAREIQDKLVNLHMAMFLRPSPACAKYAASLMGLCSCECRLPIVPLDEVAKKVVEKELSSLGLI